MTNPYTCTGMTLYPEDAGNKLSKVWHGDKMLRDIPNHLLSPTVWHKGNIYYVDELVWQTHLRWFIPKHWLTRYLDKAMLVSGYHVINSPEQACNHLNFGNI
jgi:hypothetical protein